MKTLGLVSIFGLMFFNLGCAKPLMTRDLKLAKRVRIDLPEPSAFGQSVAAAHRFEVQNRGQTYRFPAQVEIEPDRMVVVGLTPVGSRAFALTYENGSLSYDVIPFFNLPLRPDQFMLAYCLMVWPEDKMAPVLASAGLERVDRGDKVDFRAGDRTILRLFIPETQADRQEMTLQHLQQGYWVKLETRQWEVFED